MNEHEKGISKLSYLLFRLWEENVTVPCWVAGIRDLVRSLIIGYSNSTTLTVAESRKYYNQSAAPLND